MNLTGQQHLVKRRSSSIVHITHHIDDMHRVSWTFLKRTPPVRLKRSSVDRHHFFETTFVVCPSVGACLGASHPAGDPSFAHHEKKSCKLLPAVVLAVIRTTSGPINFASSRQDNHPASGADRFTRRQRTTYAISRSKLTKSLLCASKRRHLLLAVASGE